MILYSRSHRNGESRTILSNTNCKQLVERKTALQVYFDRFFFVIHVFVLFSDGFLYSLNFNGPPVTFTNWQFGGPPKFIIIYDVIQVRLTIAAAHPRFDTSTWRNCARGLQDTRSALLCVVNYILYIIYRSHRVKANDCEFAPDGRGEGGSRGGGHVSVGSYILLLFCCYITCQLCDSARAADTQWPKRFSGPIIRGHARRSRRGRRRWRWR